MRGRLLALALAGALGSILAIFTRRKSRAIAHHPLATYEETPTPIEKLRFLSEGQARQVRALVGTPTYVYDEKSLTRSATAMLQFPNAFGLVVRFAMKACPNAAILAHFTRLGLHIDASSCFEVRRALAAGVPPPRISLSSQELGDDFAQLIELGVSVNACSVSQLQRICRTFPGISVGIRLNPGLGSGSGPKTNVGGPHSSFGIWFDQIPDIVSVISETNSRVVRVHTHIGSGSDPAVWQRVANLSLELCKFFPDAETLNLGGGFRVGRMGCEQSMDITAVGGVVKEAFQEFARETGRKLKLEIEPGNFLVANAGSLVSTVTDIVATGPSGHKFLKLDTGMTEILRPGLYGAQHPIIVVPTEPASQRNVSSYVVVGHCCESGDLLTPCPGDPGIVAERTLASARIGDICVIEGCGAYCASMNAKHYNSFPEPPEVLLMADGNFNMIRARQHLEQIWQNEVHVRLTGT